MNGNAVIYTKISHQV